MSFLAIARLARDDNSSTDDNKESKEDPRVLVARCAELPSCILDQPAVKDPLNMINARTEERYAVSKSIVAKRRAVEKRPSRYVKTVSPIHLFGKRINEGVFNSLTNSVRLAKSSGFTNCSGLKILKRITRAAKRAMPDETKKTLILLGLKNCAERKAAQMPTLTGITEKNSRNTKE